MYFKPSIKLTLVLFMLALVFIRLGLWQMERKTQKQALFDQFGNAPVMGLEQAVRSESRFARVEVYGQYDPERHVLLDNKILNGRAGVQVLTPFTRPGGKQLLVNRGWLPLAPDRQTLPEVPTAGGPRTISGILNRLPGDGPRVGEADVLLRDRWPQLVTYFEFNDVEAALGDPLLPWQLQLDPADDSGFEGRQWQAAVMGPEVHGAYALQWFSLALASLIIWIILGVRRARHSQPPAADREAK
jgi:surfeit locus 1 family protein